jgi:AmiR/NasT family two-component response regulator
VEDRGENRVTGAIEFGSVEEAATAVERLLNVAGATYERTAHLQRALDSRIVIEQAKGILAERFELGIEDAFHVLRRASRSHRIRLRELAATVVAEPETPPEILAILKRVRLKREA